MDGFEVDIAALRGAARRAGGAADDAAQADPGRALAHVRSGMPGSAAATQSTALSQAWRDELGGWLTAVRRHADGLREAADGYAANETRSTQGFTEAR